MSPIRSSLLLVAASLCGFGGAMVERLIHADRVERHAGTVFAHKLVVVDEQGREQACLRSTGSGAALEFVGSDGKNAILLGHDNRSKARYLLYYGKGQAITTGLNSVGVDGASTLYLGDQGTAGRLVAGALLTDTEQGPGEESDWGLTIRSPLRNEPVFRVMAPAARPPSAASASMFLLQRGGGEWSPQ